MGCDALAAAFALLLLVETIFPSPPRAGSGVPRAEQCAGVSNQASSESSTGPFPVYFRVYLGSICLGRGFVLDLFLMIITTPGAFRPQ